MLIDFGPCHNRPVPTVTSLSAPLPPDRKPAAHSGSTGLAHVLPISSLRFVLAVWVVFGHFGPPLFLGRPHERLLWAARAVYDNLFNGPAAVIVFFVISGFCIHFPNRNGLAVRSWRMYYARRYLRILIPMSVAIALSVPLKMRFGLFSESVLWSLLCEEIYYLLYPVLLMIRDRAGWRTLMAFSWIAAYLTVLTNPTALNYPSYGPALNWVLGLPCWLLGCRLAEKFDDLDPTPVSDRKIWEWRGCALFLSVMLRALEFHSPLRPPWTLNLFAVFAFFWLQQEFRYYREERRKPPVENLGEASYSIYLTHLHGPAVFALLPFAASLSPRVGWCVTITLCSVFAGAFYFVVERPSHRFARRYANRFASISNDASVPKQDSTIGSLPTLDDSEGTNI